MATVDEIIQKQLGRGPERFDTAPGGSTMLAVVTTGNGGLEKLAVREVRRPLPGEGEVLVRVLAAGVNATDVNTRAGWYGGGGWSSPSPFPFIQGTDCCGLVEAAGPGVDESMLGKRVLVRPCMRPRGFGSLETVWFGSDFDGAFAQYALAPASEAFPVRSELGDASTSWRSVSAMMCERRTCSTR